MRSDQLSFADLMDERQEDAVPNRLFDECMESMELLSAKMNGSDRKQNSRKNSAESKEKSYSFDDVFGFRIDGFEF